MNLLEWMLSNLSPQVIEDNWNPELARTIARQALEAAENLPADLDSTERYLQILESMNPGPVLQRRINEIRHDRAIQEAP